MTHHPTTDARSCAYDLLIAGAGVAGIAAALEAARAGLDVALVEKTVLVGGLATTGLINIYLPLCDGRGHQVIFGIAEELLHLSIKYGPGDVPPGWRDSPAKGEGQRYRTPFNPASFILALDEALEEAGVDLWLDTLITRPLLEGDRVAGVVVENKSGSATLRAKCVIDATGDGDLAHRAGAPCAEGDNWLCIWALQSSLERAQRAVADPDGVSLLDRLNLGGSPGGAGHPEGLPPFRGTEGRQVTEFILGGRRMLRDHYVERQALGGVNDRRQLFPVTLPSMAQFRTTRRILGREGMAGGEEGRYRDTSIGLTGDWRKAGPIWEIP
ncbi:MAG: FAD-dependent oxidoreductase, partial [Chloroflexi bacterium]|nr:FAD-dependent oxidoreductase [Chloroflexota bacterium]